LNVLTWQRKIVLNIAYNNFLKMQYAKIFSLKNVLNFQIQTLMIALAFPVKTTVNAETGSTDLLALANPVSKEYTASKVNILPAK